VGVARAMVGGGDECADDDSDGTCGTGGGWRDCVTAGGTAEFESAPVQNPN
jgi:hypothetical protein